MSNHEADIKLYLDYVVSKINEIIEPLEAKAVYNEYFVDGYIEINSNLIDDSIDKIEAIFINELENWYCTDDKPYIIENNELKEDADIYIKNCNRIKNLKELIDE